MPVGQFGSVLEGASALRSSVEGITEEQRDNLTDVVRDDPESSWGAKAGFASANVVNDPDTGDVADVAGVFTTDAASDTRSAAEDALDFDVPWEFQGAAALIAVLVGAVALGQLFNINVGDGE